MSAEKRKRGRPRKNTTKIEVQKNVAEEIKDFILKFESGYYGFNVINNSISTQAYNISSSLYTEVSNKGTNAVDISKIKWALSRFPELEYLIDLYATSVVFNSSNQNGISVYVAFEDEATDSTEEDKIKDLKRNIFTNIKFEILELFRDNDISDIVYNIAKQIPTYGFCYVYLTDNYTTCRAFNPEDVGIKTIEDKRKRKRRKNDARYDSNAGSDPQLENLEFYLKTTGEMLDKDNLYILSNSGSVFGKSLIAKIVHYLKIIDLLEISLLIERLSKSKTLNVQTLNIKEIQDESDIQALLAVYRNAVLSKTAVEQDADLETVKTNIFKNLIDNNVMLPVEGNDMLKIETIKSEFKPILEDINYYQEKIYFSLGIPLYYRNVDLKNVSNIAMAMHEESFASKVRFFQNVINKFLNSWVELYLNKKYNVKIKYIDIRLLEYIPASRRKETDADKAKKMLDVFVQLSSLLGIQLKQEFILSELFPDKNPEDIVEIPEEVPQEEVPLNEGVDNTSEDDIFSLFVNTEAFDTKELAKRLKNKGRKTVYEIKAIYKF